MRLKQLNIHVFANVYNQPQRMKQRIISWSKTL